jgi:CII-binding regulator of phage lambda lysogenization HflD
MYKMFKKNISNLGVIISLIVLLSEISILPSIQIGIYGQQEQQQKIGIRKIINDIAQQVASAHPDTNSTHVKQVIEQLSKHSSESSSKAEVNKEIRQIASQVARYPNGIVSQLLSHFAQELTFVEGEVGYDDALAAENTIGTNKTAGSGGRN